MSIVLSASEVFLISLGGTTIENDIQGACTSIIIDFEQNIISAVIKKGTGVAGVSFSSGSSEFNISINVNTGSWTCPEKQLSGQIGAGALTNLKNTIKGWRNTVESFAVNNVILNGTITPW